MKGPELKEALVLSGGGRKGAWQAGVMLARAEYRESKGLLDASIIAGISVGALNGSFLSMYSRNESVKAIKDLQNLWFNIDTKNVHKRWFPFGMLHGLWKPSLYNSKPLMKMVKKTLDLERMRNSGRELRVGAVSLSSGKYQVWAQDDKEIIDGVLASSSFPGFLNPIKINDELWSDGGLRNVTPLKTAIDLGADKIDVILPTVPGIFSKLDKKPNSIDTLKRTLSILVDEVIIGDIKQALLINNLVSSSARFMVPDKRYVYVNVIQPSKALMVDPLDFSPDTTKKLFKLGYSDGKNFYKNSTI